MIKRDIVREIAQMTHTPQRIVVDVLDGLMDCIMKNVKKGEEIKLVGFGKFNTTQVKAKEGYNPSTREKIIVPAYTKIRFKPSRMFKDYVNE